MAHGGASGASPREGVCLSGGVRSSTRWRRSRQGPTSRPRCRPGRGAVAAAARPDRVGSPSGSLAPGVAAVRPPSSRARGEGGCLPCHWPAKRGVRRGKFGVVGASLITEEGGSGDPARHRRDRPGFATSHGPPRRRRDALLSTVVLRACFRSTTSISPRATSVTPCAARAHLVGVAAGLRWADLETRLPR